MVFEDYRVKLFCRDSLVDGVVVIEAVIDLEKPTYMFLQDYTYYFIVQKYAKETQGRINISVVKGKGRGHAIGISFLEYTYISST